jgi:hypothetical protein
LSLLLLPHLVFALGHMVVAQIQELVVELQKVDAWCLATAFSPITLP